MHPQLHAVISDSLQHIGQSEEFDRKPVPGSYVQGPWRH